jgi:uncharacterized protein YjbI with pentapeptide repeats
MAIAGGCSMGLAARTRALLRLVAVATVIVLALGLPTVASATQTSPPTTQDAPLEQQKLRQEIRKLELENQRASSRWAALLALAPFITAVVAIAGIGLTVWKQLNDNAKNRQEQFRQLELDRKQREADSLRRFDQSYTKAVENLGSDSKALQISAAAALLTFLKPRYQEFHSDVFLLLVANLKTEIGHDRAVRSFLVQGLERAIRLELENTDPGARQELDLSRTDLTGIDLAGLDLRRLGVLDVAFADLTHANLTKANLWQVKGYKVTLDSARLSRAVLGEARLNYAKASNVQLHEADLVSATLEHAKLSKAEFQRARLQAAHLHNADLRGAKFAGANLDDTWFTGATLDEAALNSITNAKNWRDAHFDDETRRWLEKRAAERSRAGRPPDGEAADEEQPPAPAAEPSRRRPPAG